MLLALAVLLLHPQIHPALSIDVSQIEEPAAVSDTIMPGDSSPVANEPVSVKTKSLGAASSPALAPETPAATPAESSSALPAAPVPNEPGIVSQVPAAATLPVAAGGIHRMNAVLWNVVNPKFETRRDKRMWLGLSIVQSTAASFDAWSTRREISFGHAQELNPFLKPFAGNSSLYVVTQITPVAFDYLGHYMMYSRHSWERHVWWLPQVLGTASSFAAGGHNLTVRATPAQ